MTTFGRTTVTTWPLVYHRKTTNQARTTIVSTNANTCYAEPGVDPTALCKEKTTVLPSAGLDTTLHKINEFVFEGFK